MKLFKVINARLPEYLFFVGLLLLTLSQAYAQSPTKSQKTAQHEQNAKNKIQPTKPITSTTENSPQNTAASSQAIQQRKDESGNEQSMTTLTRWLVFIGF